MGRPATDDVTRPPSVVLGLSAGFHDAAAALVVDGHVVAAVEEERLSRVKHDASFPARAIDCCLAIAGLGPADIGLVAFHEKPLGVLDRHLSSRLGAGPAAAPALLTRTPAILRKQLSVGHRIDRWFARRGTATPVVAIAEHHTSHGAAAFYPSPFDEAAIVTVDGVGEWATASLGEGRGARVRMLRELRYPDSVGLLYSAMTEYCGFRVNSGEGELMGLAALGTPTSVDQLRDEVVSIHDDGSIRLDPRFFRYQRGRRTTSPRFHQRFGGPPRPLGSEPTEREADLAASIQVVVEDIVLAMAAEASRLTGSSSVCLAGGVALNCVANGRLQREGPFDHVWVQPAAGDGGNAVGAALWAWHDVLDQPRTADPHDAMRGSFLGPSFSDDEIAAWLDHQGIAHRRAADDAAVRAEAVDRLADGQVVGWFQDRMEFGPRALGHRSILADPRDPAVHARINELIKHRSAFRPLAPAVLASHAGGWFDGSGDRPYMTVTTGVAAAQHVVLDEPGSGTSLTERVRLRRSTIPAVTHVDRTARIQTVDHDRNPSFAGLLEAWNERTGCPVLLNTSFNGPDEPIVCTPADAHRSFRTLGLDLLVLGRCLVERS